MGIRQEGTRQGGRDGPTAQEPVPNTWGHRRSRPDHTEDHMSARQSGVTQWQALSSNWQAETHWQAHEVP